MSDIIFECENCGWQPLENVDICEKCGLPIEKYLVFVDIYGKKYKVRVNEKV